MEIRLAKLSDLDMIVEIHYNRFSNFFLTTLGKKFLKTFYKAFLKEPGILIVLLDEGNIKGFAAGSINNQNFFKKLFKNNFFGFIFSGIQIIFTNPKALKRIFSNTKKSEDAILEYSELLSIATVLNKKGYGKILLDSFEKEVALKNKGTLKLSLTTDYEDNDKAVKFYKDCEYEVLEVFESYQKRKMYRFIKNI
ncbi:GNAT family N-acetyltransferase [Elizabethkingia bruuniana]|uniref:GNAT family N-acetyltransferase n=1 Tax=Elizabethkingia bruuniana TaxID=1756149 RepID=A0A7T7ZWH0_9FLAO|nr:GNAT family N-acetyltransferase [Elizabethkingia bruuniana]AQX83653.1 hypothetical protein AYC65_00840 [Elizabethkingia bruuniana]KUY22232.1 hypothetical protein ATB97_13355 [Elizabethkingia bruuniana]OPB62443.1 hypothetical protein BAY12_11095 [Elizabethkingia bruuniana]QQN57054.1 GNAT family N-acetyltransferase [Elizabethkingia bruuniana]